MARQRSKLVIGTSANNNTAAATSRRSIAARCPVSWRRSSLPTRKPSIAAEASAFSAYSPNFRDNREPEAFRSPAGSGTLRGKVRSSERMRVGGQAERLAHDEERPRFDLHHDASDILAHDAKRHALQSAEQRDQDQ